MGNLPEYEQELYRNLGSKFQMDMLGFNKEHTIVFEGNYLPDVPLAAPLSQHQLSGAAITQVVRELDMSVKSPIPSKGETYGIYGYCDFKPQNANTYEKQASQSANTTDNLKRLILKTDNTTANDLSVKLRRSLLKRCQNLRVRTDIQSEGLFFVQSWLLKLIPQFELDMSKPVRPADGDDQGEDVSEESLPPFEFASFSDDFVPFIAKNQFKSQIRKHAPLPKRDSTREKIAMIMNPMEMTLT